MTVSLREMMERMREEPGGQEALEVMGHRAVLGSNVHRLRAARGWTQSELAERAGMAQPRIANLENELGNPRLDTICRVALALGVEPAELLRREGGSTGALWEGVPPETDAPFRMPGDEPGVRPRLRTEGGLGAEG